MKKLILCSAVVLPLMAGQAMAQCNYGGSYAMKDHDNLEELIAKETDPDKLALLIKQQKQLSLIHI